MSTEEVYAGGKGSRLVAEENVQVVADVKGAGDLRIDVAESEFVAVQKGRRANIADLTQSVDVSVDVNPAGHISLSIDESQTVTSQTSSGHKTEIASQREDVGVRFSGAGSLGLNVAESESFSTQDGCGKSGTLRRNMPRSTPTSQSWAALRRGHWRSFGQGTRVPPIIDLRLLFSITPRPVAARCSPGSHNPKGAPIMFWNSRKTLSAKKRRPQESQTAAGAR